MAGLLNPLNCRLHIQSKYICTRLCFRYIAAIYSIHLLGITAVYFISFVIVKMAKRSVEAILKYHFSNRKLLDKALLAAGAPVSSKRIQGEVEGNKRLALVGDSVLQEAVLGPWYNSKESTSKCAHT